ncbi:MAG: EMC3/TMCO1 family protein, partial [Candidatus Thorarchaeota archaeon]
DIFGDFILWFTVMFKDPPMAGIFILLVSMSISTMSNLAMRRFTDMRRLNKQQAEIKKFREMEQEAKKTQNEKLLKKLRKRKAYIDRIQREQMGARCKPSLLFFIPFIFIFSFLRTFYNTGGVDDIVVVLPFNIQKVLPFLTGMLGAPTAAGFGLSFYGFYFIVGLGLSSILQRIMGTQVLTS